MGYEAKLSLKQAPALALNPALLQAIKLLPLAHLDLIHAIREEFEQNPMLEEVAVEEDGDTPAEEEGAPTPDAADSAPDGTERYDINWAEYVPEEWEWKGLPSEEYGEQFSFENTVR